MLETRTITNLDHTIAFCQALYGTIERVNGKSRLFMQRIAVTEFLMDLGITEEEVLHTAMLASVFYSTDYTYKQVSSFLRRLPNIDAEGVISAIRELTMTRYNKYSPIDLIANQSTTGRTWALLVWLTEQYFSLEHSLRYNLNVDEGKIEKISSEIDVIEHAIADPFVQYIVDVLNRRLVLLDDRVPF